MYLAIGIVLFLWHLFLLCSLNLEWFIFAAVKKVSSYYLLLLDESSLLVIALLLVLLLVERPIISFLVSSVIWCFVRFVVLPGFT